MRALLAFCAALVAALVLAGPTRADTPYPGLDPAKVAEVFHYTALLGRLPQKTYPVTPKNSAVYTQMWEVEILPWFAYEGVSDPVIPPVDISYFFGPYGPKSFIDGYVFHILGLSACQVAGYAPNPFNGEPSPVAGPVFLNGRLISPASPWYQDLDWLPVLVHELAHSQGICVGPSPFVESSTQLVTLEVLAAMANSGNDQAVPGLVSELRDITLGALYYEALRDGATAQYEAFYGPATGFSARETARHNASTRFWNKDRKQLQSILQKYSWSVYLKAKYGVDRGSLVACNPRKARTCGPVTRANVFVPLGGSLVFDDLAYFLSYADERVAEISR